MPLFLFIFHIFFYNIHTYIHTITFIRRHSLRPLSISSSLVCSVGEPPCGAELGIELGPALQQADALPTEPRRTMLFSPMLSFLSIFPYSLLPHFSPMLSFFSISHALFLTSLFSHALLPFHFPMLPFPHFSPISFTSSSYTFFRLICSHLLFSSNAFLYLMFFLCLPSSHFFLFHLIFFQCVHFFSCYLTVSSALRFLSLHFCISIFLSISLSFLIL
jgi:hypothetical protein